MSEKKSAVLMITSMISVDKFKAVLFSGGFIQANWKKYEIQGFVFLENAKLKFGSPILVGSTKLFNDHGVDSSENDLLQRTCMISL